MTAPMAERMHALRLRFVERAAQDRAAIAAAWANKDRDALIRLCHSLAGNAGMFGFGEIGTLAGQLEDAARDERPWEVIEPTAELLLSRLAAL